MPIVVTSEMLDTTVGGGVLMAVCVAAFYVYCKLPQWRKRRGQKRSQPEPSAGVAGKRFRSRRKDKRR